MDRRRSFAERPPGPGDRPRRDFGFQQRKPFVRYRTNGPGPGFGPQQPPGSGSAPTGSTVSLQAPPAASADAVQSADSPLSAAAPTSSRPPPPAPLASSSQTQVAGSGGAPSSERTRARGGRGRGGRGRGRGRGRGGSGGSGKEMEPSCIVSRAVLKSDRDPALIKAWCVHIMHTAHLVYVLLTACRMQHTYSTPHPSPVQSIPVFSSLFLRRAAPRRAVRSRPLYSLLHSDRTTQDTMRVHLEF